jgi:hypothetical protein
MEFLRELGDYIEGEENENHMSTALNITRHMTHTYLERKVSV